MELATDVMIKNDELGRMWTLLRVTKFSWADGGIHHDNDNPSGESVLDLNLRLTEHKVE